jgi:hypothetical protein
MRTIEISYFKIETSRYISPKPKDDIQRRTTCACGYRTDRYQESPTVVKIDVGTSNFSEIIRIIKISNINL